MRCLHCIVSCMAGIITKEVFIMKTNASKNVLNVRQLTVLGLMTGMILLMGLTPIGYIKTGTLSITLITIPVAITAYALGTVGGVIAGLFFGITSLISAFTNPSPMMVALTEASIARTVVLCLVPRTLDGLLIGLLSTALKKTKVKTVISGAIAGFGVAFLNTVFFMSSLVILFGNTEYVKNMRKDRNVIIFIIAIVTMNVVIEWISTAVVTSAVSAGLQRAGFIKGKAKAA